MINPMHILAALCALLALCGMGYYVLCTISARNFLRDIKLGRVRDEARRSEAGISGEPLDDERYRPPVSILKPLRGTDPEMYEAFRSHCLQDYPEFELIFGVSDPQDPAIDLVNRLKQEFPERSICLIYCTQILGANVKVSNLVQMLPGARYEHLLVNDSDIRVKPDYLRRIFHPFASGADTLVKSGASATGKPVGMVTALYRGLETGTIGSKLEAIGIATDFMGGVLSARQLEGIHFGLGSTLAFTKAGLSSIGGFEPLLDYLADDFELGRRLSAKGYEVVLSDAIVDTFIHDYDFKDYWAHQQRWARTVRDARKWGYIGVGVTFGVPWAMVAVIFAGGAAWSWAVLAVTTLARYVMAHTIAGRVLRYRDWPAHAWLIPIRDVLASVIWFTSFAGHKIIWRGNVFTLKDGKLRPMTE
jgi:ceramide glucosyltransferase